MKTRLIHIAPELPPTVGGVADYTAILSHRLVEVSEGAVEPVLVHAGNRGADTIEVDFPAVNLDGKCSAAALSNVIREYQTGARRTVVLLEYANYGYDSRGIPFWLLRGLSRVCGSDGIPLVAMIHELYATGPPWSGAFWYSVPQRFVTARVARLAQQVIANRSSARKRLARYRGDGKDVHLQPVFSNVGEPTTLPSFNCRSRTAVVFGGKKEEIYRENVQLLQYLIGKQEFEEVLDIGPAGEFVDDRKEWITPCGILPAESVSEKLSRASLGVIVYPSSRLSKSGGAAAFASHGVPFVLIDEDGGGEAAPYVEGRHFFRWSSLAESSQLLTESKLEKMSCAIRTLYMERMHSRLAAQSFAQILRDVVSTASEIKTEHT